jgi:alpha-ribazole phosphatase
MEFILIRHTRCEVPPGVCYGHLDLPLCSSAAADIALTLNATPVVDVVFTSPSERCLRLARQLAQRDRCHLVVLDGLRELNFGAWEGMCWDDIPRASSDYWALDPWNRAPPNGESESELCARVERAYRQMTSGGSQRIGIVAHGGPLRLLRCLILGKSMSERWEWAVALGESRIIPGCIANDRCNGPID